MPERGDRYADASGARGRAGRFPAAPLDLPARILAVSSGSIMAALVAGGLLQCVTAIGSRDLESALRGVAFVLLGSVVIGLLVARLPVAYRLDPDEAHGTLLVIERRRAAAVRIALARYERAERVRRVVFPWVPLLSGTRLFGLRGARIEESLTGFWSFGCDGRRAVVLSGAGRPRTLLSPADAEAFLEGLAHLPDVAHLVRESEPLSAASSPPESVPTGAAPPIADVRTIEQEEL